MNPSTAVGNQGLGTRLCVSVCAHIVHTVTFVACKKDVMHRMAASPRDSIACLHAWVCLCVCEGNLLYSLNYYRHLIRMTLVALYVLDQINEGNTMMSLHFYATFTRILYCI